MHLLLLPYTIVSVTYVSFFKGCLMKYLMGIVGASVVNMIIGMVWYSSWLFGAYWLRLIQGLPPQFQPRKDKVATAMIGSTVTAVIMAAIMACFIDRLHIISLASAFHFGWMVWLGFVATTTLQPVLFSQWPLGLYVVNNGFNLVAMIAMSVVLVLAL